MDRRGRRINPHNEAVGRNADAMDQAEGSSAGGVMRTKGAGLRSTLKRVGKPPDPKVSKASAQSSTVVLERGMHS
jgi:hypothetical protein